MGYTNAYSIYISLRSGPLMCMHIYFTITQLRGSYYNIKVIII